MTRSATRAARETRTGGRRLRPILRSQHQSKRQVDTCKDSRIGVLHLHFHGHPHASRYDRRRFGFGKTLTDVNSVPEEIVPIPLVVLQAPRPRALAPRARELAPLCCCRLSFPVTVLVSRESTIERKIIVTINLRMFFLHHFTLRLDPLGSNGIFNL
jgi:hypothetical protein